MSALPRRCFSTKPAGNADGCEEGSEIRMPKTEASPKSESRSQNLVSAGFVNSGQRNTRRGRLCLSVTQRWALDIIRQAYGKLVVQPALCPPLPRCLALRRATALLPRTGPRPLGGVPGSSWHPLIGSAPQTKGEARELSRGVGKVRPTLVAAANMNQTQPLAARFPGVATLAVHPEVVGAPASGPVSSCPGHRTVCAGPEAGAPHAGTALGLALRTSHFGIRI